MTGNITIPPIKQNITPAAAVKILAANGLHISEKEAVAVVNFLYTLASSTIHHD